MNQLHKLAEFRRVLSRYHPSPATLDTLQQINLALLIGPTSCGRNTIIKHLVKNGHYHSIVSDTTRRPRSNDGVMEQDGVEYWFRSEEDILADLKKGRFLEAAIIHQQQVSGISMRELEQAATEGRVAINEIEVVGGDNVHSMKPNAKFVFILPPGFDECMARITLRGAVPEDELRRRLHSAVHEITTGLERDYYVFVVNDTFSHAAERVDNIVRFNKTPDEEYQAFARQTAEQLVVDIKSHLGIS